MRLAERVAYLRTHRAPDIAFAVADEQRGTGGCNPLLARPVRSLTVRAFGPFLPMTPLRARVHRRNSCLHRIGRVTGV